VPSLSENQRVWGHAYDWPLEGEEWSEAWGGVSHQWSTTLFPRLQGFLPVDRILEIAPGYGRWTHFLRDLCSELIIVDIAEAAIAHCRERFSSDPRIVGYVNDGSSLPMVSDESIDLVFSFDSLVHAEFPAISGYLKELSRILAADGVAFLHHSNMDAYEIGAYDPNNINWRATSVSAALVECLVEPLELSCISQETIAWGNETLLNDCFSVIVRAGSRWDRPNVVVENLDFTRHEIAMAKRFSTQYPPLRRDVRLRWLEQEAPSADPRAVHAHALELLEGNQAREARSLLHEEMQRVIDPEVLNDLAVLAMQCGDTDEAIDLLRALVRLHPDDAIAARNLAALTSRR
jgi:SAM-dependent methyltransferase